MTGKFLYSQACLVVVDAQCGFTNLCPREFPVPHGLEIVPLINRLLEQQWQRIDASQDWHPPDHCSFFGQCDNLYPPHCIMQTPGANFLPGLRSDRFQAIWRKGFRRDADAYALTEQHPGFTALLRAQGVTTVVITGLTTNICCFYTARDLRQANFRVLIAEDACAGIDIPATQQFQVQAKEEGCRLGLEYRTTATILALAE